MPFDGIGRSENAALDKLDAVTAILANEDKWCKGSLRTPDGRRCLVGAMQAVNAQAMLEPVVLGAIKSTTGRQYWRIEHFNDHRATTHALVLQVLDRARVEIVEGRLNAAPARPAPLPVRPVGEWVRGMEKRVAAWVGAWRGGIAS